MGEQTALPFDEGSELPWTPSFSGSTSSPPHAAHGGAARAVWEKQDASGGPPGGPRPSAFDFRREAGGDYCGPPSDGGRAPGRAGGGGRGELMRQGGAAPAWSPESPRSAGWGSSSPSNAETQSPSFGGADGGSPRSAAGAAAEEPPASPAGAANGRTRYLMYHPPAPDDLRKVDVLDSGGEFIIVPRVPPAPPRLGAVAEERALAAEEKASQGRGAAAAAGESANTLEPPKHLRYQGGFRPGQDVLLRPTCDGGAPTVFMVEPQLPAGLCLHAVTGVISGRVPAAAQVGGRLYVVTAANEAGFVECEVTFCVGARPPQEPHLRRPDAPAIAPAGEEAARRLSLSYSVAVGEEADRGTVRLVPEVLSMEPGVPTPGAGAAQVFSVEPPLPHGLSLCRDSGTILVEPDSAVGLSAYRVTVRTGGLEASTDLRFSVRAAAAAAGSLMAPLSYPGVAARYSVGDTVELVPCTEGHSFSSWAVEPELPAGLHLCPATGLISGSPSEVVRDGAWTVAARGAAGREAVARLAFAVQRAAPCRLSYPLLAREYPVLRPMAVQPTVLGEVVSYCVSPSLPEGLEIDPRTGEVRGMPLRATPEATYEVTARNETGSASVRLTFAARVVAPRALKYPQARARYRVGEAMRLPPRLDGGGAETWDVRPPLPPGLELDARSGEVRGAALATAQVACVVTASNGAGSTAALLAFAVDPAPPTEGRVHSAGQAAPTRGAVAVTLPRGLQLVLEPAAGAAGAAAASGARPAAAPVAPPGPGAAAAAPASASAPAASPPPEGAGAPAAAAAGARRGAPLRLPEGAAWAPGRGASCTWMCGCLNSKDTADKEAFLTALQGAKEAAERREAEAEARRLAAEAASTAPAGPTPAAPADPPGSPRPRLQAIRYEEELRRWAEESEPPRAEHGSPGLGGAAAGAAEAEPADPGDGAAQRAAEREARRKARRLKNRVPFSPDRRSSCAGSPERRSSCASGSAPASPSGSPRRAGSPQPRRRSSSSAAASPAGSPCLEAELEWLPHIQVELTRAGIEAAKGQGNALFAQGATEASVEWFSKAIWLVDSNQVVGVPTELRSILYSNRAFALATLEKWEQAEADASAAVELNPENTKARFRRATARVEMGRAAEALQDVEQVLAELGGEDDNRHDVLALRDRILRQQQGTPAPPMPTQQGTPAPPTPTSTPLAAATAPTATAPEGQQPGGGRAPHSLSRSRSAPALPWAAPDAVADDEASLEVAAARLEASPEVAAARLEAADLERLSREEAEAATGAVANCEEPPRAESADLAARPRARCVLLLANLTNAANLQRIGQVREILEAEGIPFDEVDGSDPANRELRTALFGISGRHAEYPQVFLRSGSAFSFVAGHTEMHAANEISGLIKANPQLATSADGARARQSSLQELLRDCLTPAPPPPPLSGGGEDAARPAVAAAAEEAAESAGSHDE